MRAILISVDYSDILALTLPANRSNFTEVTVVTSTADYPNVLAIAEPLACRVIATDLFYKDGADFNKWAALEFGLDCIGREGWLAILDADIVWPKDASIHLKRILRPGYLYCPRRRMMTDISSLATQGIPDESTWHQYPLHRQEREFAGYSQIFHADDPVLRRSSPPWHDTRWLHGGGSDSAFQAKWSEQHKIRPPFHVLHIGPAGTNWCGRSSAYIDGTVPEKGQERYQKLSRYMQGRRRGGRGDPFAHEKLP
jgi:hypothetical protein